MLALVTATLDSMSTLPSALKSVRGIQSRIKHVFVDGGSTDGTASYIRSHIKKDPNVVIVEQAGKGLYEALNQGIQVAIDDLRVTHIGLLHSDDRLIESAFERYLSVIETESSPVFYSGIEFHDNSGRCRRVWESGEYSKFKLNTGWMPPHTSMIVTKDVYCDVGMYNPQLGTAADYDWVVRVLTAQGENSRYFPERTLSMLVGGASNVSLKARLRANRMDGRVWADKSTLQALLVRICKPLRKIGQFKVI
ncbi:MAG: glycosyltransferase [Woeseiaceae bacterium]|nr:glycosyltransferase [Woeseiaceae bacterium]